MSKVFQPKKKIENQQYDSYWKLTVEYTDIYDRRFNNTLKTIVKFIDDKDLTKQEYQKEYYKELQEQIYIMYPKSDYASIRKSINQFIKLGFIKPFFKGYHTLTKKFLNTTVQEEKRSIFSQVFYENSSFNSSTTTDSTNIKETNFLLKTLAYHPDKKLSRNDIIALMVTPGISEISKGYLTKDELEEQYQYSKIINFEENKYNQISYLFAFLNLMPNIKADKNVGIHFIDPNEVEIDTKRDPILYGIYKNDLDNESIRLYGKKICYIQKTPYKGLVHSHIKDSGVCLDEGKIDEAYDYNNGLLLSAQVDAYFDKYDISFDDNGNVLVNDYEIHDNDILHWISNFKLDKKLLNPERLKYLKWHREKFRNKALKSKAEVDKIYKEEFDKKTSD